MAGIPRPALDHYRYISPGRRSTLSIRKPRDRRLRVHGIVIRSLTVA